MIVIDASALTELLVGNTPRASRLAVRAGAPGVTWHAPHLIDLEVLSALRRLESRGNAADASRAVAVLATVDVTRYAHDLLAPRIWSLRGNLTAYDAAYVALAEALRVPLVTCDSRLAHAPGHRAVIERF